MFAKSKRIHPTMWGVTIFLGINMTRILLAKIAAPHGIKGLVKILPFAEDVSLLEGRALFTGETGDKTITLTLKNALGKYILAHIDGVQTRNDAEDIKGSSLYINRADLPEINKNDTYYIEDLVGRTVKYEDGAPIGTVAGVYNFGAGDLIDIKPSAGGDTYFVPFNEEYVLDVNDDAITVKPFIIEG